MNKKRPLANRADFSIEEARKIQKTFRLLALLAISVLSFGTVFYHLVEKWSWVDSFYFCVVTLSTVGYGDFSPTTEASRLFTVFYILIGIGIIATFATNLFKASIARREIKLYERTHKED
jgi:voltage-gated potassium channel Kch